MTNEGVVHLLMQGDEVQPNAGLPGEEVGAIVAVLQHGPAVRGVGGWMTGISRTPEPEERAGVSQTLRTGIVVVQEPWSENNCGTS